jgi:hypothetical protein
MRHTIAVEPRSAAACYDLARYSSCVGAEQDCVTALRDAVTLEPGYWNAARDEPLFDPVRPHVDAVLQEILAATLSQAERDLLKAGSLLTGARPNAEKRDRLANALRKPLHSVALVGEVGKALEVARAPFDASDYEAALAAAKAAANVRAWAFRTSNRVDNELQELITARKEEYVQSFGILLFIFFAIAIIVLLLNGLMNELRRFINS